MVCPNCHSDQVIAVQDQHFCVNCGQIVPEPPVAKAKAAGLTVQENGLPEGVKILPVTPLAKSSPAAAAATAGAVSLIKPRQRIAETPPDAPVNTPAVGSPAKKRKPGRPKAGRLDQPRPVASTMAAPAPAAALPPAPKLRSEPATPPVPPSASPLKPSAPRRMSDIAPTRPIRTTHHLPDPAPSKPLPVPKSHPKAKKSTSHHPGVPPLHFKPILAFSLRARVRPRLIALATLGSLSLAVALAYAVWLLLHGGINNLANTLVRASYRQLIEATLLTAIYYLGRSLGQAAITYGLAREADQRPVGLSRQFGVAINTFGRRLSLDSFTGLVELLLLGLTAALVVTGGSHWPVHPQLQLAGLFLAFLVLLYLATSIALTRGLAEVALTLTTAGPLRAFKLGWRLFSHRFELLGLRFLTLTLELIFAVPLAAVAIAFTMNAPAHLHLAVSLGVGALAGLAGGLFGAGSAAWWTGLYRQLVLTDQAADAARLISGRPAEPANRASLALLVSLVTLLAAAALTLPWLQLT